MSFSLLWDLLLWNHQLSVFVDVANVLGWSFPSSILCRTGVVTLYWLNLVLSWNILFCPSIVIESFAGYSSLDWHPCSLNVFITLDHDLLAFIVSNEKSGIILIGLPFMFLGLFCSSSYYFSTVYFSVLNIMWQGDFFYPVYLVFCKLLLNS